MHDSSKSATVARVVQWVATSMLSDTSWSRVRISLESHEVVLFLRSNKMFDLNTGKEGKGTQPNEPFSIEKYLWREHRRREVGEKKRLAG